MNIFELVVLALSLSLDSFSAAVFKGMECYNLKWKYTLMISILFSIFQSFMPLLGYLLGHIVSSIIIEIGHFLSFIILVSLGVNMIRNSNETMVNKPGFAIKTIILLAIAISIDAFSVGITFINLNINIGLSLSIIFIITFITSMIGVIIGNKFESILNSRVLVFGGLALIALGIKVLLV